MSTVDFSVDGVNFVAERLKPFEQFNLILKIISLIAKGTDTHSAHIEQMLHNFIQSGKNVEVKNKLSDDVHPITLLIDAIKGALSSLSDFDRDELVKILLKNAKINHKHASGTSVTEPATIEELDKRLKSFQSVFKLLSELVKINLGFL